MPEVHPSNTAVTAGIDTEVARRAATAWVEQGDESFRAMAALRDELASLHLGDDGLLAGRSLGAAAEVAWTTGTLLRLACDAVESRDRVHLDDPAAVAALALAAVGVAGDTGFAAPIGRVSGPSPFGGDLGGTHSAELRSPYAVGVDGPVERGRDLVVRALTDTADEAQIHADEFEVVQLEHDRFIVVLPGVTDLSRPDPFLSDRHRSVRDLDQSAWSSAWSSDVDDNPYARSVRDGIRAAGVPSGSKLLVVGHSFGADAAIDLAADPSFNGGEYRVTHVVAAGYHVDEYLADVPEHTDVLVLENSRDVAVIAEAIAHGAGTVAGTVGSAIDATGELLGGDLVGAVERFGDSIDALGESAGDLVDVLSRHRDDLAHLAAGVGTADWGRVSAAAHDLVTLEAGVHRVSAHVLVDVFDGESVGAGHHPSNYVEHVATTDDPRIIEFLAGLDGAGYAAPGSAAAIDVSVPRR